MNNNTNNTAEPIGRFALQNSILIKTTNDSFGNLSINNDSFSASEKKCNGNNNVDVTLQQGSLKQQPPENGVHHDDDDVVIESITCVANLVNGDNSRNSYRVKNKRRSQQQQQRTAQDDNGDSSRNDIGTILEGDDDDSASNERDTVIARYRQPKNMYQIPMEYDFDNFTMPSYHHNADEEKTLNKSLVSNFIFSSMSQAELQRLIEAFEPCSYTAGECIIKQGDVGDYFYVLLDGGVDFMVNGITVGSTSQQGSSFGELALLYSCPRAASVIALQEMNHFLRVDSKTFRHILRSQTKKSTDIKMKLLQNVPFLLNVSEKAIKRLANSMTPRIFDQNEMIVKKGDLGDQFYIIHKGSLICTDIIVGNKTFQDLPLGPGDYFGERALVTSEPRAANVVSTSKGIAFSIDKRTFEKVLGKMSDLIMKAQDVRLIGGVPFIHDANLNSDQLEAIACHVVEKQYKKGDIIFEEGSSIQASIYLVRMNGKIALKSCNNNDDNKFNGDVIGGGGYFGECIALAAFQTKDGMTSAPYTATASEDTVCGILAMNDCLHIIGSIYGNDMKVGTTQQQLSTIQFEDLEKIDILGEGTFGQVWLVRDKTDDNSPPYALKIQSKYDLIKEGQAKASLREKKVMSQLRHPFLVRLMNTYQDAYFIYILLQSIQGGELFTLIHEYKTHAFPEQQAKFYVLAIADALVYMGLRHFVYRDLKPENVMIDEKGYPILVDFGFAKHVADKTFTICGTPGYISPECLLQRGYDVSADHWAIGILIYELLTGANPFFVSVDMNQMDLFKRIMTEDYTPPSSDVASKDAIDLVEQLLVKDPTFRLGSLARGAEGILEHQWFNDLDVTAIRKRELAAPWVPDLEDPFDLTFFDDWSKLPDKTSLPQKPIPKRHDKMFIDF